jgi:hypothetical protein
VPRNAEIGDSNESTVIANDGDVAMVTRKNGLLGYAMRERYAERGNHARPGFEPQPGSPVMSYPTTLLPSVSSYWKFAQTAPRSVPQSDQSSTSCDIAFLENGFFTVAI